MDKKYLPKNEYLNIFEKCNVFIAPRKKEGIGITIVEAISKGMFVVGYNDSTIVIPIPSFFLGAINTLHFSNKLKYSLFGKNFLSIKLIL